MAKLLDQLEAKLDRASEHIEMLHAETRRHLEGDFYSIAAQLDQKGHPIIRITRVEPFPLSTSVLVGEIAHQLRSVLDHIAFALSHPRSERAKDFIGFPIFGKSKRFKDNIGRKMPGAPNDAIRYIESIQPYHRRKEPRGILLGKLQAIDNWCKHRTLPICAASVEGAVDLFVGSNGAHITGIETRFGRLKKGHVMARLTEGRFEAGSKIYAKPKLALLPVFDKGSPKEVRHVPVTRLLPDIGNFIRQDVTPRLLSFL